MFVVKRGEKVKVGEPLGDRKEKAMERFVELKEREMTGIGA